MLPMFDILMAVYTIGFSLTSGAILLDAKVEICVFETVVYLFICILWPILMIIIGMICILHLGALSFGAFMELKENFR